ncbi:hypothetical protein S40288_05488 [Stachybotrys chartarum IBT 40288]|nr:hypothetical protein S40288_05488 [Stachybotrys chartarum IBT 40288]
MYTPGSLVSALGLASLALATVVPETDYDAIVVGGGPSGLSALSGLARVRRNVLLIDSGEYRNDQTRHVHDILGFDGVTPAYYRWAAREQISQYPTVQMTNGTVLSVNVGNNNTYFTVNMADESYTARKLVLGTGLRDILPNTPGLQENWGRGVYWCPWCDGHEHADQSLGLLGDLTDMPGMVREILSLNRDIIAFVNGTDTAAQRASTDSIFPNWEQYFMLNNVTINNGTISEIVRLEEVSIEDTDPSLPTAPEGDLFEVRFEGDEPAVERQAFLASFPSTLASDVGRAMGIRLINGRLGANDTRGLATSIPGAYAVGDANSDMVTNIPHALSSGKRAAVFIHVRLEQEELEVAVAESGTMTKRQMHERVRDVWARMNDDKNDILYAGEFDQ